MLLIASFLYVLIFHLSMSKEKKKKISWFDHFNKVELDFLEQLINTPSPTWFEVAWQKKRLEYISPYVDDTFVDTYGTAVWIINPDATYKVVIEAHCDEISRFVNYITDDWLLHVIRNWWSDHIIAPWQYVHIHTEEHWIKKWVFGRPAIHTRWGSKTPEKSWDRPKVENITVDIWARSKKEVAELWIEIWNPIIYDVNYSTLNDRYVVWRALDNRAWWFMIAQVAKKLKEKKKKLDFWLYIVNSVQEEIWLKWAEMIAERIQPHVAIITDVRHDTTTPLINKKIEWDTQCWKWPTLTVWPSVHNNLLRHIKKVAKKKKIEYQMCAASRRTWTDTDAIAYSNQWVASALISLPLRYMHTSVEMVDAHDIYQTIQLIYETVCSLENGQDFSYIPNKKNT